jgi:hypothetical protein
MAISVWNSSTIFLAIIWLCRATLYLQIVIFGDEIECFQFSIKFHSKHFKFVCDRQFFSCQSNFPDGRAMSLRFWLDLLVYDNGEMSDDLSLRKKLASSGNVRRGNLFQILSRHINFLDSYRSLPKGNSRIFSRRIFTAPNFRGDMQLNNSSFSHFHIKLWTDVTRFRDQYLIRAEFFSATSRHSQLEFTKM